jgi:hypothetical protein
VLKNNWYDIPILVPPPGNPANAEEHVEFGHADNNQDDMNVSLDYFESLIRSEMTNWTSSKKIVLMGDSQGAGMAVLYLQTTKIAADLGTVISYAGFHPTDF